MKAFKIGIILFALYIFLFGFKSCNQLSNQVENKGVKSVLLEIWEIK